MVEKEYRIKETDLTAIADSIRYKHNSTSQYSVEEMPQAIREIGTMIPEGYIKPEGEKDIDTNGIHDVTEYASVNVRVDSRLPEQTKELIVSENGEYTIVADTGYVITEASVSVNVPDIPAVLQDKTVVPTKSQQEVVADAEYDGLGKTTVLPIPDEYLVPAGKFDVSANGEYSIKEYEFVGVNIDTRLPGQEKTLNITNNGSYSIIADEGYELSKANINVSVADIPAVLQEKEITPTKNIQVILPDEEYEGFSNVTVNPIPDEYSIPTGTFEAVHNGLYDVKDYEQVRVAIPFQDKSILIQDNGYYEIVSDEGYALSQANITVQMPREAVDVQERVVLPTKETQIIVPTIGYEGISKLTVKPIPDEYIIPEGILEITENDTYDVTNYSDVKVNITFPGGTVTPEGTIEITENGEYEVSPYAIASVNVVRDYSSEDGLITGNIKSYYNDRVVTLRSRAFAYFTNLEKVHLPNITVVNTYSFQACSKLKKAKFENATSVMESFSGCSALEIVYLPKVANITARSFYDTTALKALIIEKTDGVCTLANINAFNNSGIAKQTGYVYVPDNLVSSYKSNSA